MTQEPIPQIATIKLDDFEIEVFKVSNGQYRVKRSEIAKLIGVETELVTRYLETTHAKSMLDELDTVKPTPHFVPIHLVASFLVIAALFGDNATAEAIAYVSICECLIKRCDTVFNLNS